MKRLFFLFLFVASAAGAATLSGSLEYRVRSTLADVSGFSRLVDRLDYGWAVGFSASSTGGAISQVYRGDRVVGSESADVLGLVGSLSSPLGSLATFTTVKGLYLQNLGTAPIFLSGFATATIPASGTFSMTGLFAVASFSDVLEVSAVASTGYRVWIVGE